MLAATSPSWPSPNSCAPSDSSAPVPWLLAMRARACSRTAWAISWPITIAASSSVSCSWSRMPVKTAILPPGMQKALICLLPIRLTSQRQLRARSFQRRLCGIRRAAMFAQALQLRVVGRRQRALWPRPRASICAYCCDGRRLELLGRHQAAHARRRADVDLRQHRRRRRGARQRPGTRGAASMARTGRSTAGTWNNIRTHRSSRCQTRSPRRLGRAAQPAGSAA